MTETDEKQQIIKNYNCNALFCTKTDRSEHAKYTWQSLVLFFYLPLLGSTPERVHSGGSKVDRKSSAETKAEGDSSSKPR